MQRDRGAMDGGSPSARALSVKRDSPQTRGRPLSVGHLVYSEGALGFGNHGSCSSRCPMYR